MSPIKTIASALSLPLSVVATSAHMQGGRDWGGGFEAELGLLLPATRLRLAGKVSKNAFILKAGIPESLSANRTNMRIHREYHKLGSMGWLRAAVLGANDGIVSTSSLVLGVTASQTTHANILIAGIAGMVAGAMSMAAGEYVSVQSQADTERATLNQERQELRDNPQGELEELTAIYVQRGLDPSLACQVASQLMKHDSLQAHARDELGITETLSARPLQAALASALSFALGALLPLLAVILSPIRLLPFIVTISSLCFLAALGGIAARIGGANVIRGIVRVTFWSSLAMAVTSGIGALFGVAA